MKKHMLLPLIAGMILSGCKPETASESIELLDEFIIMGFFGPPEEELTAERFMEVAESGIDILVQGNGIMDGPGNLRVMDLAQEAGVRILPFDTRILGLSANPEARPDSTIIKEVVADYKAHPAFAAYVIRDEPHSDLFPLLRDINTAFRAQDPLHEPFINLFPSYGTIHQLGSEDYTTYVRSFIETVRPGILSYDNYPTRLDTTLYEAWYKDLRIVREETLRAGIPFMVFILSEGIREGLRLPNRAEVLWQVNSAIAYGAQGFGWFCYWTPPTYEPPEGAENVHVEHHHDAMINIKGERTPVYDHVKEANAYIRKVGEDLLSWESEAVARYHEGELLEGSSPVMAMHVDGGLVVGTFSKGDQKRVILSNASCEEACTFTMEAREEWQTASLFSSIEAKSTGNPDRMNAWNLEAGGSVVIDLEKE